MLDVPDGKDLTWRRQCGERLNPKFNGGAYPIAEFRFEEFALQIGSLAICDVEHQQQQRSSSKLVGSTG